MIRLDDAEVAAQVRRAEAELQAARYSKEEVIQEQSAARFRVDEAREAVSEARAAVVAARGAVQETEAALAAAEAQAELARTTLGRYRQLLDERALSRQEFDEAVARERTAQAEAARARARLDGARAALDQWRGRLAGAEYAVDAVRLRVEGLESRVRAAQARIGQIQAEVSSRRTQLAFARIVAPASGVVVAKEVEVGELATPGRVLLTVEDPSAYRLEAQLASRHAGQVRVGQAVWLWVGEPAEGALQGRVAEIVPAEDPSTRSVTVKVDITSTEGLRSGQYGKVRFVLGASDRLVVPVTALVERGQLAGVYVADAENVARFRLVTLGERHDDRVEILSGLEPGERIVAEGIEGVSDGRRLKARP